MLGPIDCAIFGFVGGILFNMHSKEIFGYVKSLFNKFKSK